MIYSAIIVELLIIIAFIFYFLKDKKMFAMVWDQIFEIIKELSELKSNKTKSIVKKQPKLKK